MLEMSAAANFSNLFRLLNLLQLHPDFTVMHRQFCQQIQVKHLLQLSASCRGRLALKARIPKSRVAIPPLPPLFVFIPQFEATDLTDLIDLTVLTVYGRAVDVPYR